uniref:Uncharacterized protein n=1 Tax=Arundo donax TaxID=35708 RepID=A0A0A9HMG1_ARUDO
MMKCQRFCCISSILLFHSQSNGSYCFLTLLLVYRLPDASVPILICNLVFRNIQ